MKNLVLPLLLAAWPMLATSTTVTGPIYNSDGSLYSGTITIRPSQSWIDSSGAAVGTKAISLAVVGGAFTVGLYPTDASLTTGVYYTFTLCPTGQPCDMVRYQVQTSASPVTIGQLNRISTPPTLVSAAAGDLAGSYPAPTVSRIQGRPVSSTAPTSGQVLSWDGGSWTPQSLGQSSCPTCVLTSSAATGDLTGSTFGSPSISKLQGTTLSASSPSTASPFLRYDGSAWAPGNVVLSDFASASNGTGTYNTYSYQFAAPSFNQASNVATSYWYDYAGSSSGSFPVGSMVGNPTTGPAHASSLLRLSDYPGYNTHRQTLEIYTGINGAVTTLGHIGEEIQLSLFGDGASEGLGLNIHMADCEGFKCLGTTFPDHWAKRMYGAEIDMEMRTTAAQVAACAGDPTQCQQHFGLYIAAVNSTQQASQGGMSAAGVLVDGTSSSATGGPGLSTVYGFGQAFISLPGAATIGLQLSPLKSPLWQDHGNEVSNSQPIVLSSYTAPDTGSGPTTDFASIYHNSNGTLTFKAGGSNKVFLSDSTGTALAGLQFASASTTLSADTTLISTQLGQTITGNHNYTLPTPTRAGQWIAFYAAGGGSIQATAPGGVTIRDGIQGSLTEVSSTVAGSWILLEATGTTAYAVRQKIGRWDSDLGWLPDQVALTFGATSTDGIAYAATITGMQGVNPNTILCLSPNFTSAAGSQTLAINGGAAAPLRTESGAALAAGEFVQGRYYWVQWDAPNSRWVLLFHGSTAMTTQLLAGDGAGSAVAATAADMSGFTSLRVPTAAGITLTTAGQIGFDSTSGRLQFYGAAQRSIPATADNLSVFSATTSAQLRGVVSDETGSGALVFATGPTFTGTANTGFYAFSQGADIDSTGTNVTIAPTASMHRITNGGSIQTITAPGAFASQGGCVQFLAAAGATWSMVTGGNIARVVSLSGNAGRVLTMCYSSASSTWYPSW